MIFLNKEYTQKTLRNFHNQGIEITPEELTNKIKQKTYTLLRAEMMLNGISPPMNDEKMEVLINIILDIFTPKNG
jgi:hypothetical protein